MTAGKRIFLNTIASYGRSLIGVSCGIFSTRWVLAALGTEDFGLYGLVGSFAMFLCFFSIQFSQAISRYYAYSVGQAQVSENRSGALHECRAWFSVALIVHLALPIAMCAIGWPIGEYAISHGWLTIPAARVGTCLWLWRFVCVSCFAMMASTPFHAMFTAKQEIVELTAYSLLSTLARTAIIYYMFAHPSDWLLRYGLAMLLVGLTTQVLYTIRALVRFPECRFVPGVVRELGRIKQLANYAFWQAVGGLGYMAGHEIMGVILNKSYGPVFNASFGISQTVAFESGTLTGSLQAAFAPAITTTCGAGDLVQMRRMALRVCKIGTLLTLLMAIPMMLEIEELLVLWLKEVPPQAGLMCLSTILFIIIEKLSCGHVLAVNANGNICRFQCLHGVLRLTAIPLALVPIALKAPLAVTMLALPLSMGIMVVGDVILSRRIVGLSVWCWVRSVLVPVGLIAGVTGAVGWLPQVWIEQSFGRMVLTTIVTSCVLGLCSWCFVLDEEEKNTLIRKILKR